MNISIKKCDFCETDIRSDDKRFYTMGHVIDCNAADRDACADCLMKLEKVHADA